MSLLWLIILKNLPSLCYCICHQAPFKTRLNYSTKKGRLPLANQNSKRHCIPPVAIPINDKITLITENSALQKQKRTALMEEAKKVKR